MTEEKKVLAKKLDERTRKYEGRFIDVLMQSIKPDNTINENKIKIYNKNMKINEGINTMINDIDKMLGE